MKSGRVFQALRMGKKLTIADVVYFSHNKVSKSFVSKYERGECDISFDNLVTMLSTLNISIAEFTQLINIDRQSDIEAYMDEISRYYYENNAQQLTDQVHSQMRLYRETGFKGYRHKALLAQSLCSELKGEALSDEDNHALTDYLFGIDCWSTYELILLTNCLPVIQNQTAMVLVDELVKKSYILNDHKENVELKAALLFNMLVNCLKNGRKDMIAKYTNAIESLRFNDQLLFQKMILKGFQIVRDHPHNQALQLLAELKDIATYLDASIVISFIDSIQEYIN